MAVPCCTQEHHTVTTNKLGLFNVGVGTGGVYDGGSATSLSGITWGSTGAFMEVGLDLTGTCSGYTPMGRSQMQSVPYALYAGSAGSAPAQVTAPLSGNGTAGSPIAVGYDNSSIKLNGSNQLYAPNTGTVTSVATNNGLTGGPVTGSGTIGIATGGVTNAMLANPSITIGTATGSGLTGGGSVALGGSLALTANPDNSSIKVNGSNQLYAVNTGTITSVNTTSPITGGTITGSGTIACPTCVTSTSGGTMSGTAPVAVSAAGVVSCATCATTTNGGALSATAPASISAAGNIAVGYDNSTIKINGSNQLYATYSGAVTSIGVTVPSILSVSPASITSSGTFAFSLATQAANTVFAGPTTGAAPPQLSGPW